MTEAREEPFLGSLFTRTQREAIRQEYAKGGVSQQQLADRYGVHRRTIGRLLRGETHGEEA
jgi:transcriptional regulator with XRE-family HTH domain